METTRILNLRRVPKILEFNELRTGDSFGSLLSKLSIVAKRFSNVLRCTVGAGAVLSVMPIRRSVGAVTFGNSWTTGCVNSMSEVNA